MWDLIIIIIIIKHFFKYLSYIWPKMWYNINRGPVKVVQEAMPLVSSVTPFAA